MRSRPCRTRCRLRAKSLTKSWLPADTGSREFIENGAGMNNLNDKLAREERGATAIEYAIMASLIAGVVAATVSIIGGKLVPIYNAAVAMFP